MARRRVVLRSERSERLEVTAMLVVELAPRPHIEAEVTHVAL